MDVAHVFEEFTSSLYHSPISLHTPTQLLCGGRGLTTLKWIPYHQDKRLQILTEAFSLEVPALILFGDENLPCYQYPLRGQLHRDSSRVRGGSRNLQRFKYFVGNSYFVVTLNCI